MPKAKVKDGCSYGAGGKHPPGTVLDVTEQELASFPDKLERVAPTTRKRKVAPKED